MSKFILLTLREYVVVDMILAQMKQISVLFFHDSAILRDLNFITAIKPMLRTEFGDRQSLWGQIFQSSCRNKIPHIRIVDPMRNVGMMDCVLTIIYRD